MITDFATSPWLQAPWVLDALQVPTEILQRCNTASHTPHLHFKQTFSFPLLSRLNVARQGEGMLLPLLLLGRQYLITIKRPICYRQAGMKTRTDEKAKYGIIQKTVCYMAIWGLMPVNTANSKTNVMGEKEFSVFFPASPTPNTGQRQIDDTPFQSGTVEYCNTLFF